MATPIKYVPQKKNGTLLWVPVYKKGEGPSAQKVQPVQQPVQQVEEVLSPPSSYFHKKYQSRHKGTIRKGIITEGVCKVCDKPFTYSRSGSVKQICSSFCAYEAQKGYNRAYNKRRSDAKKLELRKKLAEEKAKKKETKTALCKGCGKSFQWKQEGRHAPRKFCEARCRLNYWAENQGASQKTDRGVKYVCKNCNKPFLHTSNHEPFQRYCTKKCRTSYNSRLGDNPESQKTFVERVAEHLPPKIPLPKVVETTQPAALISQPPSWETLVEEAGNMGIELDKEPSRAQNFYIALLMARRAHHHEEWKKLLKSQNVRIRQLPETYMALKSVSGESAIGAARALKTRMGM